MATDKVVCKNTRVQDKSLNFSAQLLKQVDMQFSVSGALLKVMEKR